MNLDNGHKFDKQDICKKCGQSRAVLSQGALRIVSMNPWKVQLYPCFGKEHDESKRSSS